MRWLITLPLTGAQIAARLLGVVLSVIDSNFFIVGSSDATKRLRVEVDAQTTGKTLTLDTGAQTVDRTLTAPVLTGNRTLAVIDQAQTISGVQSFSDTTDVTSTTAAALKTAGGLAVLLSLWSGGRNNLFSVTSGAPFSIGNSGSNYPDFGYNMVRDATGTQTYRASDKAFRIDFGNSGRLTFQYAPSGTAAANITWQTWMYMQDGVSPSVVFAVPATHADHVTMGAGANLILDTATGSKIGTSTTQKMGFWNATPVVKPTVTGSRGGNAALASLLTQLATMGLLTDSSS